MSGKGTHDERRCNGRHCAECTPTPHEAAGRALHLIEHPCVAESTWEALDEPTRTFWINRARPVTEAIRRAS